MNALPYVSHIATVRTPGRGRCFLRAGRPAGRGSRDGQGGLGRKSETDEGKQRTPLTMIVPPAILVVGAILVGLLPHLGDVVQAAAVRFQDQAGYRAVLSGAHVTHPVALYPAASSAVTLADVVSGVGSAVGGVLLAGLALYWRRIPLLRRSAGPDLVLAGPIRRFQSGVINDYVTWVVVGLACLGAAFAFSIR